MSPKSISRRTLLKLGLTGAALLASPLPSMAWTGIKMRRRSQKTNAALRMMQNAGLESNLALCLDPAEIASYPGSGQTWSDLSPSAAHFYLGTGNTVDTRDPLFVGTGGGLSANDYFQFDGGDIFSESATHTFAESWHTSTAAFSVLLVMYLPTGAFTATHRVFSNVTGSTGTGTQIYFSSTGNYTLRMYNSSGSSALQQIMVPSLSPASTWYSFIFSFSNASSTLLVKKDADAVSSITASITSPSAGASRDAYTLFGDSDGLNRAPLNSRVGALVAWNRALTSTEMDTAYRHIKRWRFTGLP